MRLSSEHALIIRTAARKYFGEGARVWLFGSRVDDKARGGDIDFLIEAASEAANQFRAFIQLEIDLQNTLGDQKIDIFVSESGGDETPIHRIARATGIEL